MEYSGAGGKVIHEKNQKQKISWHCPFKAGAPPVSLAPVATEKIFNQKSFIFFWDTFA